jgi:hypothetical protein
VGLKVMHKARDALSPPPTLGDVLFQVVLEEFPACLVFLPGTLCVPYGRDMILERGYAVCVCV